MINTLPKFKTVKPAKIVGRGVGSGKGSHTTGRGTKGQKSRSGYSKPGKFFEGGQNPISKRFPHKRGMYGSGNRTRKRGFITSKELNLVIKVSKLENIFTESDNISETTLIEKGILSPVSHKTTNYKILKDAEFSKKLNIQGIRISKSAQKSLEDAGGTYAL